MPTSPAVGPNGCSRPGVEQLRPAQTAGRYRRARRNWAGLIAYYRRALVVNSRDAGLRELAAGQFPKPRRDRRRGGRAEVAPQAPPLTVGAQARIRLTTACTSSSVSARAASSRLTSTNSSGSSDARIEK